MHKPPERATKRRLIRGPARAACILGIVVLSGCSLGQSTTQWVEHADLNKAPEGGQARVVVLREKAHIGFVLIAVTDDLKPIGALDMGAYVAWDRPPGRSTLKIKLQPFPKLAAELPIDFESGKTYYFRAIYHGDRIKSPVEIEQLGEAEARLLISKSAAPIN